MKFVGKTYSIKGITYKVIKLDKFTTALIAGQGKGKNYYLVRPSKGKEFVTSDYYLKKATMR